ncbi:MAG: phage tail tape measure protein [Rhodospirillales bacterium]
MSGDTFSIKAIIRAVDQFSPTMKRMATNMDHFGKMAQSVGKGMTASVSAPIAAFGGLTLKTAVDFESAMNRVEAISGETGDSLKAMRDLAKSLGSNTAFSAGQAADAMGFLAQAGWKANKILAGTPAFLDLAAASGTDLADAAGIASKIMGQFGISAGNASRVADVLAAATASANVDMQMIAESMKAAGPIANKYGLSLEDTAAAIGLLGNVGIQGENAGNALKNTMLAMVNPAGEAGKMLEFLRVKTRDAEGNMLPLVDVLAGFGSALDKAGIGEGQKLQAIQTMFGKEGLAGATELLAQAQSGALQKYAESLTNVEGRARSMAQTMMKGAPGAVKNLASAFEGLQLAIARSGLLEWFSKAVKGLTGFIKNLSQTSPELLKLGTIVAGVAAVAGPALWAIGAMASGIAAITTAMAGLKLALLVNPLTGWAVAAAAAVYATGAEVHGLRGQRIYVAVEDASDIERAGQAIIARLWAAGHGHVEVSASGALLERTIADASVWQPNRLDFAGGAVCVSPLAQQRGEPDLIPGQKKLLDTKVAIPDPTADEIADVDARRADAKKRMRPAAEDARNTWIEARATETAGPDATPEDYDAARHTARRALEGGVLSGSFVLTVTVDGRTKSVTVEEVLNDPKRFHQAITKDPLEPEYDDHKDVGKLFLIGQLPRLYSFAHGPKSYRLTHAITEIQMVTGRTHDAVIETIRVLRETPDVYDFGAQIATVDNGRLRILDDAGLTHFLGGVIQFYQMKNPPRAIEAIKVLQDPPPRVVAPLIAQGHARRFKKLTAVTTVPTLRPDGTVFDKPGYDETTGILYEPAGEPPIVPAQPTIEQVKAALDTLWFPFREFPFVETEDRSVMLSALLTACVRPILPTAPAFGFDAPVQASGKTLLARCVGVLASGEPPAVYPHTFSRMGGDEEIRKRLLTVLLEGHRAFVWDNIVGGFDSPALAAMLTAERFTDRILGKNASDSPPNKLLVMLTGNNLQLTGDMTRRVLMCRIDPKTDKAFAREFDLDPYRHVRDHRLELVVAGLTILRGWLVSGADRVPGRMASFENWDDLVRQAVAWMGRDVLPGEFADVMNAVVQAQDNDPERADMIELMDAWREKFGGDWVPVRTIVSVADVETRIGGALSSLMNGRDLAVKAVGKALAFRAGRICGGMRLEFKNNTATNAKLWRVAAIGDEGAGKVYIGDDGAPF